jgi:hypothetical protein
LASMDLERSGNFVEAGLWAIIAVVIAVKAIFEPRAIRRLFVVLAIAFAAFGLSDVVEAGSGAWWRPWWLFAWKVGCVLTFVLCFWKYYSLRKR